jgi:hypothetical protein
MALVKQFEDDLKELFLRRTAWLRGSIGKKTPGPPPAFTKKKVKGALERMTLTARQILIKQRGRKRFKSLVVLKRQWQVNSGKGFGRRAKKTAFRRWYDKSVRSNNCVYVFWSGRKCVYVGRTLRGKGRPSSSFDKFWFSSVTRIDSLFCGESVCRADSGMPRHRSFRPKPERLFFLQAKILEEMSDLFHREKDKGGTEACLPPTPDAQATQTSLAALVLQWVGMADAYEVWLDQVRDALRSINMAMEDWQPIWLFDFPREHKSGATPDEAAMKANRYWWHRQNKSLKQDCPN